MVALRGRPESNSDLLMRSRCRDIFRCRSYSEKEPFP